ncbi:uncharacterized protein TNCV_1855491 [Trichonephila clavipes]|nr:uncharacterized protein TNCV_1855491 [Trichonephila clavipes]
MKSTNRFEISMKKESFRLTASRVARDKPWSTLCKKSHGIPSSPRAAAVAKLRLLTGHDCLCAHLFRFNLVTSPICVLCDTGQDMTAAHLDECSALNDLNCVVKRAKEIRNTNAMLLLNMEGYYDDDSESLNNSFDFLKSECTDYGRLNPQKKCIFANLYSTTNMMMLSSPSVIRCAE